MEKIQKGRLKMFRNFQMASDSFLGFQGTHAVTVLVG